MLSQQEALFIVTDNVSVFKLANPPPGQSRVEQRLIAAQKRWFFGPRAMKPPQTLSSASVKYDRLEKREADSISSGHSDVTLASSSSSYLTLIRIAKAAQTTGKQNIGQM